MPIGTSEICYLTVALSLSSWKKCQRTFRPHEPVSITFGGCSTAQRYRPRTCGTCTDGRCCAPSLSRTVQLRFHCPSGDILYNVMWIQRCSCGTSCGKHTYHSSTSVNLYNDIHTFRDWCWLISGLCTSPSLNSLPQCLSAGWERSPLACTLSLLSWWCHFVHATGGASPASYAVSRTTQNSVTAMPQCRPRALTETLIYFQLCFLFRRGWHDNLSNIKKAF